MQDFKERKKRIFWSLYVIEVGVNVPNATVMIIADAIDLVLASFTSSESCGSGRQTVHAGSGLPIPDSQGKDRMRIMTETTNGFVLAEEDLKMRGSGDFLEPDSQTPRVSSS